MRRCENVCDQLRRVEISSDDANSDENETRWSVKRDLRGVSCQEIVAANLRVLTHP